MGSFNIFGIRQQEKLCGLSVSFLEKYLVTDSSSLFNIGLLGLFLFFRIQSWWMFGRLSPFLLGCPHFGICSFLLRCLARP